MQEIDIKSGNMYSPTYLVGSLEMGKSVFLYLHGDNTTAEKQLELAEMIGKHTGLAVALPEYSGHGRNMRVSYDDTTPAMHVSEVCMVYDWLEERVGSGNVVIYGGSYGGYLAAKLMHYRKPSQVILQAPSIIFDEDMYTPRSVLPSHKDKIGLADEQSTVTNIKKTTEGFNGKLMVMKSENDELVPSRVVDAWKEVFPQATFVTIPGAIHSIRRSSEVARQSWLDQISSFVNRDR